MQAGRAHLGEPGPAIGFLQDELRWWDHWLKRRDTGIMDEPMLRLFMQDSVAPRGHYENRPEALEPGEVHDVTIAMKHVAQSLPAGHRLRLALSSSYFPMIWPAPEPVTLSVHTQGSALELPLRAPAALDDTLAAFAAPVAGPPPPTQQVAEPETWFRVVEDAATGEMRMQIADGGGVTRLLSNDITMHKQGYETYGVMPDDVTSPWGRTEWYYGLSRGDWSVRSETRTLLRADANDFIVTAELRAWEGEVLIAQKHWEERIPRDHM